MTSIEVNINAEAVQAQVVQAILDSAIGASLKVTLEKLATEWKLQSSWESNLKKIIEQEVQSIIRKAVHDKLEAEFTTFIGGFVTPQLVQEATQYATDNLGFKQRY